MLRSAIAVLERTVRPRNAAIAMAKQNLSVNFGTDRRYEEAGALLRDAVDIALENLGPDHPAVALMRTNLGLNLHELGDDEAARRELEGSLRIRLAAFGPDHPLVFDSRERLAIVWDALGEQERAEAELEDVWQGRVRLQGEHHADTCQTLMVLADKCRSHGRLRQALEELERARERMREADSGAAQEGQVMLFLAKTRWELGQTQRAIDIATAARRRLKGDEPDVRRAREDVDKWLADHG